MTRHSPLLTLNNGIQMPAIGLGVFQSPPEQTVTAVESALAQGYRLIDTAAAYFNERQVGDRLRRSGVARGVSNFMPEHLQRLLADASVVPAVNQIEVHPYFQQTRGTRTRAARC